MKRFFLICIVFASIVYITNAQMRIHGGTSTQGITVANKVVFSNGASYTPPTIVPNTSDNPIGRFSLGNTMNSATMSSVTITFTGDGSGMNSVKLWSSADNLFGSDTQVGSTLTYGTTVTFSGLTVDIPYPGAVYLFVTIDLGESSGSLLASIATTTDILCSYGFSTTISNAPLSNGEVVLPVELSSLTAMTANSSTVLFWKTEMESNNYGFEIERRKVVESMSSGVVEWSKVGFVQGAGTSNVENEYSFTDTKITTGKYEYRLKQIDNDGAFKYSHSVEVSFMKPTEFSLMQNYPNPFNPSTTIRYDIPMQPSEGQSESNRPSEGYVSLKVYDILGKEVATLVNETKEAGRYDVKWNASHIASGVYFYKLIAGNYSQVKKLILMK